MPEHCNIGGEVTHISASLYLSHEKVVKIDLKVVPFRTDIEIRKIKDNPIKYEFLELLHKSTNNERKSSHLINFR